MVIIGTERRAWWPVKWDAAAEDGGGTVENRLEMRFRILDVDAIDAMQARANAISAEAEAAAAAGGAIRPTSEVYAELVMEIAVNWRGVGKQRDEGSDEVDALEWTPDNVRLLMRQPGAWFATLAAFRDCIAGRAEIREKN